MCEKGGGMKELKKGTYKWIVNWLPELSVAQVTAEFQFRDTQSPNMLNELDVQLKVIGRSVKEIILKEICQDSVEKKLSISNPDKVYSRCEFGFDNTEANWVLYVKSVSLSEVEGTDENINVDQWEQTFKKSMYSQIFSDNQ